MVKECIWGKKWILAKITLFVIFLFWEGITLRTLCVFHDIYSWQKAAILFISFVIECICTKDVLYTSYIFADVNQ